MANGSEAPENTPNNPSKKPSFASVLVPVAAILACILVSLAYYRANRPTATPPAGAESATGSQGFIRKVGATMPDFELKTVEGKVTRLSEIKGKVVLINFWATWCGPCVREMPSLQKLSDAYTSQGLAVVGISLDEDPAKVLAPFLKKHEIHFPTYSDANGELADLFDVSGLPLTLVLDSNRKILLQQTGDEDWFDSDFRKQFEVWLAAAK